MEPMCGRFAVTTDPALLAQKIQAIDEATSSRKDAAERAAAPNYNVAPTADIAAVVRRHSEPEDQPTRRLRLMRWGLVPPWVKAGPDGAPEGNPPLMINARADKVTTSPAFRSSAKTKRCLVPMNGWYEWRANPDIASGKKARKTPFFMTPGDDKLICMAGLWSVWKPDPAAPPLLSCTIITTDAVGPLAEIHDRMPLMLDERDWDRWLDPDSALDPELLTVRADVSHLEIREVSTLVNSVRNNGPELIEPAEPQGRQESLL
ncbi:MAG: bacteriophage protein [Mycobacterium sp.]|jgi:putative SOS response-associated peptidase YedK|nr:bacteriophage protein [Mycobacterium sp.]